MRVTRCDHCGKEAAQQGLARLKGWAGARITERVPHHIHAHVETSETTQYEICADCLPQLKSLLTKQAAK